MCTELAYRAHDRREVGRFLELVERARPALRIGRRLVLCFLRHRDRTTARAFGEQLGPHCQHSVGEKGVNADAVTEPNEPDTGSA